MAVRSGFKLMELQPKTVYVPDNVDQNGRRTASVEGSGTMGRHGEPEVRYYPHPGHRDGFEEPKLPLLQNPLYVLMPAGYCNEAAAVEEHVYSRPHQGSAVDAGTAGRRRRFPQEPIEDRYRKRGCCSCCCWVVTLAIILGILGVGLCIAGYVFLKESRDAVRAAGPASGNLTANATTLSPDANEIPQFDVEINLMGSTAITSTPSTTNTSSSLSASTDNPPLLSLLDTTTVTSATALSAAARDDTDGTTSTALPSSVSDSTIATTPDFSNMTVVEIEVPPNVTRLNVTVSHNDLVAATNNNMTTLNISTSFDVSGGSLLATAAENKTTAGVALGSGNSTLSTSAPTGTTIGFSAKVFHHVSDDSNSTAFDIGLNNTHPGPLSLPTVEQQRQIEANHPDRTRFAMVENGTASGQSPST